MSEFSIKNYKPFASPDGGGHNLSLYRNGKKVGTCHNSGSGGPDMFYWTDPEAEAAFDAEVAAAPKWESPWEKGKFFDHTRETYLGDMLQAIENERHKKSLERKKKTHILFLLDGESEDICYRCMKHNGNPKDVRDALVKKYGNRIRFI